VNELFHIEETLSPRLKWMREHEVTIDRVPAEDVALYRSMSVPAVHAISPKYIAIGSGDTEDEALSSFCRLNLVPLWNEPQQEARR
jgi:hypothetical protein